MKKVKFSLVAIFFSAMLTAQDRVIIEPSGNIVTKNISVQSFDVIEASGLYEMILSEGQKEDVRIEADDNMQKMFSVSNHGSKLVIDMPELKNYDINSNKKSHNR